MRVIAYTYEADVHCPACARAYFQPGKFVYVGKVDEHGIDSEQRDREGNRVHPVFDIEEHGFTHCGDCRESLT